jgi:hypothetical protein
MASLVDVQVVELEQPANIKSINDKKSFLIELGFLIF